MIEEQLLAGIRAMTKYVREHEDEFVQMAMKKPQDEMNRSLRDRELLEAHRMELPFCLAGQRDIL